MIGITIKSRLLGSIITKVELQPPYWVGYIPIVEVIMIIFYWVLGNPRKETFKLPLVLLTLLDSL